jgi:hypothetical protein
MQILGVCMECVKQRRFELTFVPYYDDRVAYIDCSQGHKSALLIQSHKFEVLMESGANALLAGFTLEAASSFSTALERFYEFFIEVVLTHRKMRHEVYEEMFKPMARQSERQMGAFLALHAVELGKAYCPDKKITEFRNAVIHKGQIPTPEEVQEFCERVYGEIFGLCQTLRQSFSAAINEVVKRDVDERWQEKSKELPTGTSGGTMFFNLVNSENRSTFKEALEEYIKMRDRTASAFSSRISLHAGRAGSDKK